MRYSSDCRDLPGYGDEETWGPVVDPRDPRWRDEYEEDEDDETSDSNDEDDDELNDETHEEIL